MRIIVVECEKGPRGLENGGSVMSTKHTTRRSNQVCSLQMPADVSQALRHVVYQLKQKPTTTLLVGMISREADCIIDLRMLIVVQILIVSRIY